MPSSFLEGVWPIMRTILSVGPKSVLDVGPGWGKYGLMCLEYLDLEMLNAVEVPEGRKPTQDVVYDYVWEFDVTKLDLGSLPPHDLVLMIDVIEHLDDENGVRVVSEFIASGSQVLISTPIQFFEQHVEGNPHENHVSHWSMQKLVQAWPIIAASSTERLNIVLVGEPRVEAVPSPSDEEVLDSHE